MFNKKYSIFFAGIIILAAVLAPILYTGYSSIQRADSEYADQDYTAAFQHYQQALRLLPWRTDLLEKTGVAAYADGQYSDAIVLLSRAPKLSEQGWVAFGNSHVNANDLSSALRAYKNGLLAYDSPSLYAGLAFIYRENKEWPAERDALQNQLRLDPGNAYAHYRLGLLLTVLAPEQAQSELTLASSLDPETDSAVQTLTAALNLSATQPDASGQMLTAAE